MGYDYTEALSNLENKPLAKAMELTFTKAFPDFIANCKDENEAMKLFIYFSALIEAKRSGESCIDFESNMFYYYYKEFCDRLFDMIDSCSGNEKSKVYEILDETVTDTIMGITIEGLQKETIAPEEIFG